MPSPMPADTQRTALRFQMVEIMALLNKIMKSLRDQPSRPADADLRNEIKAVAKDGRLYVRYPLPASLEA